MKLVSYLREGHEQLALLHEDLLYDADAFVPGLPSNMESFLRRWDDAAGSLLEALHGIEKGSIVHPAGIPMDGARLLAPVPRPASLRDGYGFRRHVETARRNRGLGMIREFDEFPVFYFSNHHATRGPGVIACMADHFERLDFELEVAVVIARGGRNIRAHDADAHVGGLMIMNDFSARRLQAEEMKLSLGPAKGKDFATAFGPWLVTPDELESYRVPPPAGHQGAAYGLRMTASVNGVEVSRGNLGDMQWTFAELIERASYGADLVAGDVIGSGTVGTGCLLELNGTAQREDPGYVPRWLRAGDQVTLAVEGLGVLTNIIEAEDDGYSLLDLKKHLPAHED